LPWYASAPTDDDLTLAWDDERAPRAVRRGRPQTIACVGVAVAQTPGGLTGAVLRVGSKKPKLVARPWRVLPGLDALSPISGRHSERCPGFRGRLCATAKWGKAAVCRLVPGARAPRSALASWASGLFRAEGQPSPTSSALAARARWR